MLKKYTLKDVYDIYCDDDHSFWKEHINYWNEKGKNKRQIRNLRNKDNLWKQTRQTTFCDVNPCNWIGRKMKKVFITVPILLGLFYIFSAMLSLHQFHRGIYDNDKKLIKEYVDRYALRKNLKNYLNVTLLKSDLGILFAGITGKIAQYTIDTYANPE